jgi:sodium/potassium-transporting ATPase subunit alpha
MLCICVGTDIYPAISLAYEESEFDIMTRKPRKIDDHLVSGKLLCHAYGQMGEIATAAGFFTYFTIMNVYGFPTSQLFGLMSKKAYNPWSNLTYNTYADYNSNAFFFGAPYDASAVNATNCTTYKNVENYPNWLSTVNGNVDLRQVFLTCDPVTGVFTTNVNWGTNCHHIKSPITKNPVCFST